MPAGVGFDDVTVQWHIQQDDKPLVSSLGHVSDHVGLSVLDLDAWVAKLRRKGAKVPERVFQARRLLEKMKKALSMLCGHPQCGEEIVHADSEVFVMVIDRGGMVRFGR